jgi:hypothetical protein
LDLSIGKENWAVRLSLTTLQGNDCAADVDDGTSAERERKDLDTGVEELDLEVSFHDSPWLSDQLIQPLFNRYALAAFVHVAAVRGAGQLPVNGDAEANRMAPRCRSPWPLPWANVSDRGRCLQSCSNSAACQTMALFVAP